MWVGKLLRYLKLCILFPDPVDNGIPSVVREQGTTDLISELNKRTIHSCCWIGRRDSCVRDSARCDSISVICNLDQNITTSI